MENIKARARRLMDCFKLTVEQWDRVESFQQKRCALCGRVERRPNQRLATDHDWFTGAFRGLLCSQCNVLLGKLERAFIRLGMHKEEGVELVAIVGRIYNYLRHPSADQALGYRHIGYPGSVSTKKHRKMIKKQKAEQKTKS
jgi:hypothetical protein